MGQGEIKTGKARNNQRAALRPKLRRVEKPGRKLPNLTDPPSRQQKRALYRSMTGRR